MVSQASKNTLTVALLWQTWLSLLTLTTIIPL